MPSIKIKNAKVARLTFRSGRKLDELLLEAGYIIERPCAGEGKCGKCAVRVSGGLEPPAEKEIRVLGKSKIDGGFRLACQAVVIGDAEATLPAGAVHSDKIFGEIPDAGALADELGLAIDLGSTTVGAFLVDLETKKILAGKAALNKQTSIGADIIRRLETAATEPEKLKKLAVDSIEEAYAGFGKIESLKSKIKKAVIVGNSAMHHLLLGLDVRRLMINPFEPSTLDSIKRKNFFDFLDPDVATRLPALIGGFVGSDALACAYRFGLGKKGGGVVMAVDLGTNGEVLLGAKDEILAASTAAGPAFEGVNISCGMRAVPGAVVAASIENDRIVLKTIGDVAPRGLAGSGLISVVRVLREIGVIEKSGRIVDPESDARGLVTKSAQGKIVKLSEDLSLTQSDIRELQKAKGAVRACIESLMSRMGVCAGDIERLYLTGSFGGKIDASDAVALGVIPPVDLSTVISIPNGAGLGAAMMLDDVEFDKANDLARKIKHVELFSDGFFMENYIEHMSL